MERIVGCVWVYMQKMELHYWREYGDEKKKKFGEWKALVDTVRIKSADLEDKFLFNCFTAFRTAKM